MKKFITYFIFILLFLAIGFPVSSQKAGGKLSKSSASIKKTLEKSTAKDDKKNPFLKAGVAGQIDCLDEYVCESTTSIELVPNAAWSGYTSIVWTALDSRDVSPVDGLADNTPFPAALNIITKNVITGKWYFNPANVPSYMNGEYIGIKAQLLSGPLPIGAATDYMGYYITPIDYPLANATSSICAGVADTVRTTGSTAPTSPSSITAEITNTEYHLVRDGVPTGDIIVGDGNPIKFPVTVAGVYTIEAYTIPSPLLPVGNVCLNTMTGSTTVTVNPLPIVTASSNSPICVNQTLNLTGGSNGLSYAWVGPNSFTSTNQNPSITNATVAATGTYTLVGTDVNGCVDSAKVIAQVNPLPIITLTGNAAPCVNSIGNVYTTEAGMTNYVWTIPAGATVTAGGTINDNSVTITWTTTGSKTLQVNYSDVNACGAATPTSLVVDVKALPIATISGSSTGCVNVSQTFTTEAGMSNYTWSYDGTATLVSGGTIVDNSITLSWATSGAKSVTVTYTDANNCNPALPVTKNITVNNVPSPTITGPTNICAGSTQTYLTESGGGISGWNWSVTGGTFVGANNTASVQVKWNDSTLPTTGTLSVNYLNSNGCTAAAPTTSNITLNAQPSVTLTGSASVCQGSIGNVYSTDAGMSNYSWTVSSGGTITAGGTAASNTVTVTWNTVGAQTVQVNYNAVNGCSASIPTQINVNVQAAPIPTISGSTSVCVNSSGNVYSTEAGMSSYVWTIAGGTITSGAGTNQVTVTWTSSGSQSLSVNYANAAGCSAASPTSKAITVNPLPNPTVTGSGSVCEGSTSVYTTEAAMSGYVWSVTGGVIQSGQGTNSATILWGVANPLASVSITYVNSNGCSPATPTSFPVVVKSASVPTITGNSSVCLNSIGNVYTTEAGMSAYVWTITGGTITAGGTATSNTATVTWNTAGAGSISVNYTNSNGCPGTSATNFPVTVNNLPSPTVTGLANVCVGATGVVYSTEAGMSSYIWTISPGGVINSGAGTSSISVTWNGNGAQYVRVSYADANLCTPVSPTQYNVTVNTLPIPTITGSATACQGKVSTYTTEAAMSSYVWTVSSAGSIQSGQGTNTVQVLWNNVGAAENVSVTYSNGCSAATPTIHNVNVGASPSPSITGLSTGICQGATNVTYTTESGKSNYVWTIVGGNITSGNGTSTVNVTWNSSGSQSISVNYDDVNGCSAPIPTTLNVTVSALPTPTISGSATVCEGSVNVVYTTEVGQSAYQWTVSAGGQILSGLGTNQINVKWNVSGAQSVSVNYSNAAGCSALSPTNFPITVNPIPNPSITGSATACVGSTQTYTTELGQLGYIWTASANGVIISGQGTNSVQVQWNGVSSSETVSVTYTDAIGCAPSAPTTFGVNVVALPVINLGGSGAVCTGSTTQYTAPAGMTNYQWVVTGGSTVSWGSSTDNKVDVLWPSSSGTGTVSVNYTDANGCTSATPAVVNVTVGSSSVPSITGTNSVCLGTTGVVYSTEVGMNGYVWTVSAGGIITSGAGTDQITVDWTNASGSQTVSVNYTNPSGCPVLGPTVFNVNVSALPITETISGSISPCLNEVVVYSIPAGQSNILWTVSANGTIIGANNLSSVQVRWDGLGAGNVSVAYTNGSNCSPLVQPTLPINVNALPTPTLTGSVTVCNNSTGNIYTTEAGMSGYTWIVTGGTIVSGANTNSISVTWNVAGTGTVSVNYMNAAGCLATLPTLLNVTVTALPNPLIAGPTDACINQSGQVYNTSAAVGISNYVWTISGGTIDSGAGTNQVSVTWTSNVNAYLTVAYDQNGCSGVSSKYNVTVHQLPLSQIALTQPLSGQYCFGGTGVDVILSASEPTVTYELRDASNSLVGTVLPGISPVMWSNVTAGTYRVVGISAAPALCSFDVATGIVVTQMPLPSIYNISPSAPVTGCNGGAGYAVSLDNSENGVSYQLLLNGAATGVPVIGTGSSISFGNQFTFGTYTIEATNSATSCNVLMNGSFVMNPDVATSIYNVSSDPITGEFCSLPLNGVQVKLDGSDLGVNYILRTGINDIETIAGTGGAINFTRVSAAGAYFVEVSTPTGCRATMNGSVNVVPIAPPTAFNVTADNAGYYCQSDLGVGIQVSGQEAGVVYQLYEFGNPLPIDSKTGFVDNFTLPLAFTGQYPAGTYSVLANRLSVAGCMVAMTNTVTVNANSLPIAYNVTTDGDYCEGSSTNLYLSSSELTAQYRWVNTVDNSVGAWVVGTNGVLSFVISSAGDYTIEAQNTLNGISCSSFMNDTVTINEQILPSDVSISTSGGTGCNDGVVITINSSQNGVIYSVVDQATSLSPVPTITGNGLDISFDPIIDNGKTYDVYAQLNGCQRIVGTPIAVNVSGVVVKQMVTGGGAICSGGSAIIGLSDTEVGVQYDLYLADSPGGTSSSPAVASMVGDGFAKNFGASIALSGEYFVEGSFNGCLNEMLNRVTVSINPPVVGGIKVTPNDTICANVGAVFTGTGGDRYSFYLNNVLLGVAADSTLTLPSVNDGDQVKVFVENTTSGCSDLTLPITMSVIPEINSYSLLSVSNGLICPAATDSLYLTGSEWGVDYTLFDGSDNPIDTISGNNGVIYFTGLGVGSYYVIAQSVGGSPCGPKAMNDTVTVAIASVPTIYNMSPVGTQNGCSAGSIDLDGSDNGLVYYLIRDGIEIGMTSGTGAPISFVKPLVAGNYTIEAVFGNGCRIAMNGSLSIVNPVTENIYTLSSNPLDGRYCNEGSSTGVLLSLDNSDSGKTYSLFNNSVLVKDSVSTGGSIDFGSYLTAGFYTVQVLSTNGCYDMMNGVVHVDPINPPLVNLLQVDDNGFYCSNGGLGVGIQLVGQELNVVYKLYNGGVLVGQAIGIDTNPTSPLPFLNTSDNSYRFTAAGVYSATAEHISPASCLVNMGNTITVTPSPDPSNYLVTTTGDFCDGSSSTINVNGSDVFVDYRWFNLTSTDAGPWTIGTGGLLQFTGINIEGDYIIQARNNNGSSCPASMNDTISIHKVALPLQRNFTVETGIDCSSSSLVIVENAESGVTYTIVDATTNIPTTISFVGTTNLLDTLQIIDAGGVYYLEASRGSCPTRITPDFTINNPGAVKKHIVLPEDASICNGDLGVRFGLATSDAGIKYYLYWTLNTVKDPMVDQKVDSLVSTGAVNLYFKKLGKKQGKYYVIGETADKSCWNYMINEPQLVVNPLPLAYRMTGSGMYCNPDPDPTIEGAIIGLESQQDHVLYTLQQYSESGSYVNDVVEFRGSLSGNPFSFGSYKEQGLDNLYRVVAIDTISGCTSNMEGEVVVNLTPFAPVAPIVDLGSTNGKYCAGSNGVEVRVASPEVGITYQILELPKDTVLFEKVATTTDPLVLGYFGLGDYYLTASWGGDACSQSTTPFTITSRVPISFNVDYDCHATPIDNTILSGGYVSLDSSEVGITYLLYKADVDTSLVGFANGIDNRLEFEGIYGTGTYFVQGTCSPSAPAVDMANDITITFPLTNYSLSVKNRDGFMGVIGDTIQQVGSQLDYMYYLRLNNWVDTFAVGTGTLVPPLEFSTDSTGEYHILAISDKNCGAIFDQKLSILQTALIARRDTLNFPVNSLTASINVSDNDIIDWEGADKNIVFKIVSFGQFTDVKLDSISGLLTYNKLPTFYGLDSLRYEVRNKDIPNRADTALVWIFIGNDSIGPKSFLIPNAFSPNGDGVNDQFAILTYFAGSTEESQLEVYNRWGSLVYRSKGKSYDNHWDGTTNAGMISIGTELPNGTYFYVFKVTFNMDGVLRKEEYNGYIELRR